MRSMRFLLREKTVWAAALSACLALCLSACIGGTGTDTENGVTEKNLADHKGTAARVVDGDGKPMAGVTLTLHTPDFRPDSSVAEDLLLDSNKTLVTDTSGYARFHLVNPGKYVVEGRLNGTVLLFDTLAVSDVKTLAAYTYRSRAAAPVQGKVRLASGLQVVSGKVFVRGTERTADIDAQGNYNLGSLPPEISGMAVGLTYKAAVVEARVAEQKPDTGKSIPSGTDKPVFACREVTVDSAARLTSKANPGPEMIGAPQFAAKDTVKLDTAKVAAVERSCDSIPGGTVIAVRTPDTAIGIQKKDTVTTNLIAVDQAIQKGARSPDVMNGGLDRTLVPLNGCVALPGTTNTTFEVRLNTSGPSSDLLVADVADKCLVR